MLEVMRLRILRIKSRFADELYNAILEEEEEEEEEDANWSNGEIGRINVGHGLLVSRIGICL